LIYFSGRGLGGDWQAWRRGLDSSGPIRNYIVELLKSHYLCYCRWLLTTYQNIANKPMPPGALEVTTTKTLTQKIIK